LLILGLDPGSRHTGYAFVEAEGGHLSVIAEGRISLPSQQPLSRRLAGLSRELTSLLDTWEPDAAAVESPFAGLNSKSLIVLAQARGVILALVGERDMEIKEYSPAEVKIAVAGNGRADKSQVSRMVHLLLALEPADRSADQTDALAVAVCYARHLKMDQLTALHGVSKTL